MWKGGLFPFHWFLSEGEEVNIKMKIFIIFYFFIFIKSRALILTDSKRFSSEFEPESVNQQKNTPFTLT